MAYKMIAFTSPKMVTAAVPGVKDTYFEEEWFPEFEVDEETEALVATLFDTVE